MLPANPNPQDMLLKFANWCVVVTTILTVPVIWPLTSLGNNMDLDLIGIFKLFVIPVNSGWVPLSLAILWSGTSALGIIAGRYIIHISYKGCPKKMLQGGVAGKQDFESNYLFSCNYIR